MKRLLLLILAATLAAVAAFGQAPKIEPKAEFSGSLAPADARAGEGAQIVLTIQMKEGWHIYAPSITGEFIELDAKVVDTPGFQSEGALAEPRLRIKYDRGFQQDVVAMEGTAAFGLPVKIANDAPKEGKIRLSVTYQACDARNCDPPKTITVEVPYKLADGEARGERLAAITNVPAQPAGYVDPGPQEPTKQASDTAKDATREQIENARSQGLGPFLLLAFLAGIAALATPCVWPMIPITVSFFSKRKDGTALPGAAAYCLGIIGTFTALGVGVSLIFGASGVQMLAANVWVNLFLAALFVVLALNLFGVYEIQLPAGLVNKMSAKGRQGGLLGPVFMGLAFSLTSFTCTVPFAGTVLASASQGDWLYPALGMMAFSTAFAIPFFLLALFPQWLNSMPKSGGWLVAVKAYMGFLELAAALKFLSNVDLTLGWGLLTREVFLAVWFGIFAIAAFYLMGALKLPHDSGDEKLGWGRRIFGVVNMGVAAYLLLAIQGQSMGQMTAFLPPHPYPGKAALTGGIAWKHTVEEGQQAARSSGKLIFINFTGVTCSNCRVMEGEVFPQQDVRREIEKFVPVELYTDRPTPEDAANAKLRDTLTQVATNPVYVVATPDLKVIKILQGLSSNQEFINFLVDARKAREGATVAAR